MDKSKIKITPKEKGKREKVTITPKDLEFEREVEGLRQKLTKKGFTTQTRLRPTAAQRKLIHGKD